MPKLKHDADPAYRLHRQSGQAIVTLNGLDFLLGPFGDADSHKRYHQLIVRWRDNANVADRAWRRDAARPALEGPTIHTVAARYREYVEVFYRNPD
ncbi:MAG: hypothetical protein ABSH08_11760, partial [Tepidisphaeraceae bacterium]